MPTTIYLIPSILDDEAIQTIPTYIIEAVKNCSVIFAENERTTRRFLKSICKEIIIDSFEWFTIHKAEVDVLNQFSKKIIEEKNIAIFSEAGCPGVADPGQILIEKAHQLQVNIKPLVGPSSILLALMASGMNGQQFEFLGYLPIDNFERNKAIISLETSSLKNNSTKIFIETPYRNNQMIDTIFKICKPSTRLCIAANITGKNEFIKTKTIAQWKMEKVDFHKQPVIFLIQA